MILLRNIIFVILVTLLALSLLACGNDNKGAIDSSHSNEPSQTIVETSNENNDNTEDVPSIAGICLDDTKEKIDKVLGKDYKETFSEVEGHFGEPYYLREYIDGISLIIGKNSRKVLEIELVSGNYQTWLGDNIGDTAGDVLSKYREKYAEPKSIHSDEKLEGWFDVGDGILIIFDFNKDDDTITNVDISPDSKVELIKLTKMQYMD